MTSELITAAEIGERLRVRPATVRLWTQDGIIPAVRITGKVIRYDVIEVITALRQRSKQKVGENR